MVSKIPVLAVGFFFFAMLTAVGVGSGFASSFSTRGHDGEIVVNDSKTGLAWQQNTADTNNDGTVTPAPYPGGDSMKWQQAIDYCEELDYGGTTSWRLPEYKELMTLVDHVHSYPAIDPVFQCESHYYWSATVYEGDVNEARYVHFNFGSDHWKPKDKRAFVRCVSKD